MKKIIVILVALLLICAMSTLSFAQKATPQKKVQVATEVIRGTITSIDPAKKEIMVKDDKTGQDRAFTVSQEKIQILKVGEKVKVTVKVGSSSAESVKKIVPKTTATKK